MYTQISLRKIEKPSELSSLYAMMGDDDQYLYSVRLQHNSEASFSQWLSDRLNTDFHDFDLVFLESIECPVGFVHNYDFNLNSGHCKTVVYIQKKYRNTGIGAYAALAFVNKLFMDYPLRKIYSTVYAYNTQSIENHNKVGFIIEGILRDYRYCNGEYYDMVFFSITREQFLKKTGDWK